MVSDFPSPEPPAKLEFTSWFTVFIYCKKGGYNSNSPHWYKMRAFCTKISKFAFYTKHNINRIEIYLVVKVLFIRKSVIIHK